MLLFFNVTSKKTFCHKLPKKKNTTVSCRYINETIQNDFFRQFIVLKLCDHYSQTSNVSVDTTGFAVFDE